MKIIVTIFVITIIGVATFFAGRWYEEQSSVESYTWLQMGNAKILETKEHLLMLQLLDTKKHGKLEAYLKTLIGGNLIIYRPSVVSSHSPASEQIQHELYTAVAEYYCKSPEHMEAENYDMFPEVHAELNKRCK